MDIDRPIFFVGFGRSGSTHIHRVFCHHSQLAWLSRFADDYPDKKWLNDAVLWAFGATPFSDWIARKLPPREGWKYWDAHFSGFSEPFRDLTADDVSPYINRKMKAAVAKIPGAGRDRVLIKLTGWPRIAFLQEIFPDARFIHILRDGRAAANSLIHTDFWRGWQGPEQWRWGPLSDELQAEWERWDKSFIALAAIQWKQFITSMNIAKKSARHFTEIRYEDFCESPMDGYRKLTDFCEIDWDEALEKKIRRTEFREANFKWQQELTPRQQETLEGILGDLCQQLGYS